MAYNLVGSQHIDRWASDSSLQQCQAMAVWVRALINGPYDVVSSEWVQPGTGRRGYVSVVPDTNAMVAYLIFEAPLRAVSITSVIPAPDF